MSSNIKARYPFLIISNILIEPSTGNADYEYRSPLCIQLYNKFKESFSKCTPPIKSASSLTKEVTENFQPTHTIANLSYNEKGYLFVKLSSEFIVEQINCILKYGVKYPENNKSETIGVDFSSPNIAKNLHVGHLRSSILGDSICRILEFMGHKVHRINHLGDWGTQFGMLICYLFKQYPDWMQNLPQLSDLNTFYKNAKKEFDSKPEFKEESQKQVVALQNGDKQSLQAWEAICKISKREFEKIYERLDIKLSYYGESFYNPFLPEIIKEITEKGLITIDGGAKCIFFKDKKDPPMIVQKRDGGYNYQTTDLAALKYRLFELKCTRIIYVVDTGQSQHFKQLFNVAQQLGWYDSAKIRVEHMGFGVVLGQDGQRMKTREGESTLLIELLNEAKKRSLTKIIERAENYKIATSQPNNKNVPNNFKQVEEDEAKSNEEIVLKQEETKEEQNIPQAKKGTYLQEEEFDAAAEKLGMAALKYFDLKQNKLSNYKFSFDKMLDDKGNSALYVLYAYARLVNIIKKSGLSKEDLDSLISQRQFKITHPHEEYLASSLLKFSDTVAASALHLEVHRLTDFLYEIATKIAEGYGQYKVLGTEHTQSRILLIEACRRILECGLNLIGVAPLEKI